VKPQVTPPNRVLARYTLLFRAGVDLNEIRALLRHTRIGTTADIYVDVFDDVRRGTARSMDGILTRLHAPADLTDSDHMQEPHPPGKA